MDKILMLRKEGYIGARGIYIGMRRQALELGPMRYTYTWPARDSEGLNLLHIVLYYICRLLRFLIP